MDPGGDTLLCPICRHESASRGGADIHAAVAHAPGQPPPGRAPAAAGPPAEAPFPPPFQPPFPSPGTAGRSGPAGSATVCLGFAVVLLLFLGGLIAADRGWAPGRSEVATVAAAPAATTAPEVPQGWRTATDSGGDFSVALPPGWTDVPLDASTTESLLAEATRADPRFGASLDRQVRQAAAAGGRMLAFEDERAGAFNLTVMKSGSDGATLGDVSRQMPAELARLGVAGISQDRTTVAGGPAARITYRLDLGGVEVHQVMHLLVRDGTVFAVTLTTDDPAGDAAAIDGIARSFTVLATS